MIFFFMYHEAGMSLAGLQHIKANDALVDEYGHTLTTHLCTDGPAYGPCQRDTQVKDARTFIHYTYLYTLHVQKARALSQARGPRSKSVVPIHHLMASQQP